MFWINLAVSCGFVLAFMISFYIISRFEKNNTVVDFAWAMGFVFIALLTVERGQFEPRQMIATTLVFIWGLRLASHLFYRIVKSGDKEDYRYKDMKKKWGEQEPFMSFVYVFLLQGALMLVISLPVILINSVSKPTLTLLDMAGVFLWFFGFVFEAVGDLQLHIFKKDQKNKGKIMTEGLWRYTRHPNYFGEAVQWWALWLISLSVPGGWLTVVSPLLITHLLLNVSGIPLLEKKYAKNKRFREYAKRTNKFIPWFPKKS